MLPASHTKDAITNPRDEMKPKKPPKRRRFADEKPAKNGTFFHFGATESEMGARE